MENQPDRLIGGGEVDKLFDIEKTTRYRYIKRGIIPQPIKLAATAARWSFNECQAALERLKQSPRTQGAQ
jgi:predicted DNA-binding transcriptional regulator AlpA